MKTGISILPDTRRAKKNDTYPVKLRVYSLLLQRAKTYSTKMDLTKEVVEEVMRTPEPRKNFQEDHD